MSCELSFICDKKWDDLENTGYTKMKFCDLCEDYVFLISNRQEYEENRKRGRCVAFAGDFEFEDEVRRKLLDGVMGWPEGGPLIKAGRRKKGSK